MSLFDFPNNIWRKRRALSRMRPRLLLLSLTTGTVCERSICIVVTHRFRTRSQKNCEYWLCVACFEYIRAHISYWSEIENSWNPNRWQYSNQSLNNSVGIFQWASDIATASVLTIPLCSSFCYRNSNIRHSFRKIDFRRTMRLCFAWCVFFWQEANQNRNEWGKNETEMRET